MGEPHTRSRTGGASSLATMDGAVDLDIVSTDAKLWETLSGYGADDWAAAAWSAATAAGVFDGTDPKGPFTREEFAVILVERKPQLLKLLGIGE